MSSSRDQAPEQTSRSSKETARSKSPAETSNPEASNPEASDTLVEFSSKRSKLKSMLGMSSTRASIASSSTASAPQSEERRSSVSSAVAKLKDKVSGKGKGKSGMGELAGDEEEFEKLKAKEQKKDERKAEYERLGLDKKVKLGSTGMQIQ